MINKMILATFYINIFFYYAARSEIANVITFKNLGWTERKWII